MLTPPQHRPVFLFYFSIFLPPPKNGLIMLIYVPNSVYHNIQIIKDSGVVNMYDWQSVAQICEEEGLVHVAQWIREHSIAYQNGVMNGFSPMNKSYISNGK